MKILPLDTAIVCPLSCNNRGNRLSCYHSEGHYNYWNCETFKEYVFRQSDYQQAIRRNISNTPMGLTDSNMQSSLPALMPVDTIFEIPDNSKLMDSFRKHHPHLAHELGKKIWQNYGGNGLEHDLTQRVLKENRILGW